jgi:mannose-6-phosphate isomerase
MRPVRLPVGVMDHVYRGGAAISALRGGPPRGERTPEEWLGSVTTRFGAQHTGLTTLEDGTRLREAIASDPESWLGPGRDGDPAYATGLLVKLLHAGQRLPVHVHPDRGFARRHLGCCHGKTEAWVALEECSPTTVHLGFAEEVSPEELSDLVRRQDAAGMLARMHELPLAPGDVVLVPAGLPHALGEGAFVAEVQEPTDFSILLDWQGFAVDGERDGHLGLGFPTALEATHRGPMSRDEVESLFRRKALDGAAEDRPRPLLPAAADPYFRAELIDPRSAVPVAPGFAVLLTIAGHGELHCGSAEPAPLRRGDALVVPYGADDLTVTGDVRAVVFRPPDSPDTTV